MANLLTETRGRVRVVTLNRPERRNAVDRPTARELTAALRAFDEDAEVDVAVVTGAGGVFCAGADLTTVAGDAAQRRLRVAEDGEAPMGFSRLLLSKPVIAAVEGWAVAGGLELALWCDLRVAAEDAVFGVFCRRWGVPLCDGGTIRLPRVVGHSHAMDLILTGRGVSGEEARTMGLANRLVPRGEALEAAVALAGELAALPQGCLRSDRLAAIEGWSLEGDEAHRNEIRRGMAVLAAGDVAAGAARFVEGAGRHGAAAG